MSLGQKFDEVVESGTGQTYDQTRRDAPTDEGHVFDDVKAVDLLAGLSVYFAGDRVRVTLPKALAERADLGLESFELFLSPSHLGLTGEQRITRGV